jgi:hypothetical protein
VSRPRIYTPRRGTGVPRRDREEAVSRIYRDDDGKLPDFTRLDRRPPAWRRWAVGGGLLLLALLAVAAWASFLIFKPYTATSGGNVTVHIDAPPTAAIGQEIAYRITLANDDRVPLAQAALELRLPEDLAVTAADPPPDDARGFRWTLGTIPGNGERAIAVRGRLYGIPSQEARIEATAVYRPANFNADFQSPAAATTAIGVSPITLTIDGPTEAVPEEPVTYTLSYEHTGELVLPESVVTLEVPRTFVLTATKPDRSRTDELVWHLGALEPKAKGTIMVTGSFRSGSQEPHRIRATAAMEPVPGRRLALAQPEHVTAVLGGDAVITATVNDQTGGIDAPPGSVLRFRVAVRNDGQLELKNLTMRAIFEATSVAERSILNFSAIQDSANGTAVGEQLAPGLRRGTITWTSKEVPSLTSLPPGEQRQIDFSIPLHTAESLPGFPPQARIQFATSASIGATGDAERPREVRVGPMEIKVK